MFVAQLIGFTLLFIASVSSSISMNFQKLAQYQTDYEDPRSRQNVRQEKLETPVCIRPLFVIALVLSAAASILDFFALAWLPTAVIGVFGSMSIIINLGVTRIILFEKPSKKEYFAISCVIIGCMISITSVGESVSELTPPELIQRPISSIFIILNWVVFISCSIVLEFVTITPSISKLGYPFIGGALGAQNVCMGKYIAYVVVSAHESGRLTVRGDNLFAAILLCILSVVIHIYWLNKGLKKEDAYYCIIVYQSAWFMFTTISGIIVYDNMNNVLWTGWLLFIAGIFTTTYGVYLISTLHKT
jgi:hypothetical protein